MEEVFNRVSQTRDVPIVSMTDPCGSRKEIKGAIICAESYGMGWDKLAGTGVAGQIH